MFMIIENIKITYVKTYSKIITTYLISRIIYIYIYITFSEVVKDFSTTVIDGVRKLSIPMITKIR